MTIYRLNEITDQVTQSGLPADLAAWLKEAPKLGGHAPVHHQRVAPDRLVPRYPRRSGGSSSWARGDHGSFITREVYSATGRNGVV